MKENNNKNIIIALIIVTIIMGIITVLALTDNINLSNNKSNNSLKNHEEITENIPTYTYEDIKGFYFYETENLTHESGETFKAQYRLHLFENGVFKYELATFAPFGYVGNYIIKNNQIVLNYLFETHSDASLRVTNGTHTITINDNDTLIDSNQPITNINLTNITLTRNENNNLIYNDIYNQINTYEIINNSNGVQ